MMTFPQCRKLEMHCYGHKHVPVGTVNYVCIADKSVDLTEINQYLSETFFCVATMSPMLGKEGNQICVPNNVSGTTSSHLPENLVSRCAISYACVTMVTIIK